MDEPGAIIRVLLADDHDLVRAGVAFMIGRQPDMRIVAEAANGRAAVELYREHRPDVCLIDLRMPVMDGEECVRQILAFDPRARIVILTTYDTDEDIQAALQGGAMGYLLKDVPEADLADCVRKAWIGKTYVSPAIAARLADRMRQVQLTAREMDVLRLLSEGKANKEIAVVLHITESTVKLHMNNLFGKLDVSSRTEALRVAIQRGLIRIST